MKWMSEPAVAPGLALEGGFSTSALILPAVFTPTARAAERIAEFFAVHLRNPNTRRAYSQAARRFSAWCARQGLTTLHEVRPLHVAAYVEELGGECSTPSVKQHLAALRAMLDWMVAGQVLPTNPAHAVRGPRYSVRTGKTPVLAGEQMEALLASIGCQSVPALRDRALILCMVYTFARIGAVLAMNVEDYSRRNGRCWIRLREKGGKCHDMPCHVRLEQSLDQWLDAAGGQPTSSPLFRTIRQGRPTLNRMQQPEAYAMIRRRASAAGLTERIGCHTFRATGITAYLRHGGSLEVAQRMANHASPRTTSLYDRRDDLISLEEVQRIAW